MSSQAQYMNLKFENYSTMEGLSSSTCVEIFQDSEGFLWFGTIDGLNRYNGYEFEIYRPVLNDPNSISNNRINAIVEDGNGRIWVGTSNGLNVFHKGSGDFTRVKIKQGGNDSDREGNIVNDLLYDENTNILWIATRHGLSKLDLNKIDPGLKNAEFSHYVHQQDNNASIDQNDVTSIQKDKENNIWIGTSGKYLNRYIPGEDNFERIYIDAPRPFELDHLPKAIFIDNENDIWLGNDLSQLILYDIKEKIFRPVLSGIKSNIPVFHISQDKNGIVWISTDGYGIYLIDKKKGIIQHITHNPSDPYSLPNNQPSHVLEDKDGIYWIATYNEGVSKLALSKSVFSHYFYEPGNSNSLSTRIAQAVIQDRKKRIWIGTDGGGLNLLNENENSITHFRNVPGDPSSLSSDKILYLTESFDGSIWVCTWDGGLNKFDPAKKQAIRYKHDESDPFSIGQNTIWCAVEDSLQRLWLGTQTAGLNLFDPQTQRFYSFTNNSNDSSSLTNDFVFSIFIDSNNRLLVGTSLGLSIADLDSLSGDLPEDIHFYEPDAKDIQDIRINYITEDQFGNIWIGSDLGLHKLNADLEQVRSYSTREGLPNNLILGIVEDNSGYLWITTKSGLSRLDPQDHTFKNFNVHDGLQGMEFQSKSIDKASDGRILIGGINGLNIFDPDQIPSGRTSLNPVITKFKLFNKEINKGDTVNARVLLEKRLSQTKDLQLKYNEAYLTFEFVALYYQNPERVEYAYKMEGLDDDFIFSGQNRTANYSNLSGGDYTFIVKASVDGDWDNAASEAINIRILPPPWKTWWAYTLYIVTILLILWISIRYYTKMVREEKEHELDQMKLNFFINVSHEFRTPLTLILNPIDKILSRYADPEEVKSSAQTIQRSARRLLNLVNQLLDFRKMDLGKAPLEMVKGDLANFSRDVLMLFEDLAEVKGVKIYFKSASKNIIAWFDPDKVEKIVTNLISNAIKFTDAGGSVTLSISKISVQPKFKWIPLKKQDYANDYAEIKITDTGIGFKEDQLKDVFKRFFHGDNRKSGTGIGLNFTKGLVELHGGEILVESEYDKGTTFTIRLPLHKHKVGRDTVESKNYLFENYDFDLNGIKSTEYEIAISNDNKKTDVSIFDDAAMGDEAKRPVLLIVEDNRELRNHLRNELKNQFKIREAVNGSEGLEKVLRHYPDIIISDVMMPEMDGFELCRRLKTNIDTCHIPIVLLTARSLEEDRIEGYNTGADEYLPKPFNIHVLRARIKNLLESRKRIREKFNSFGGVLPSSELTTNSLDEIFLDKATKIVLDNVANPDFNLETLLTEVGVSRSQFYRKINSITGQNPSNFIRTIRLKHASGLLIQNQHSIKEISYMVGFNSSAYFTKTFKELFGKTPQQFTEENIS